MNQLTLCSNSEDATAITFYRGSDGNWILSAARYTEGNIPPVNVICKHINPISLQHFTDRLYGRCEDTDHFQKVEPIEVQQEWESDSAALWLLLQDAVGNNNREHSYALAINFISGNVSCTISICRVKRITDIRFERESVLMSSQFTMSKLIQLTEFLDAYVG